MNSSCLRTALLACAIVQGLPGCTVGPDYQGPPAVANDAVQASQFRRADGVTHQHPELAHWWLALDDAHLNTLIDLALSASPDLEIARARVRQAYAGFEGKRSDTLPKLNANAGELIRGSDDAPVSRYYLSGLMASWELDLFGAGRRAGEGAAAKAQASDADLADARLQLTAQVAEAYFELRSRQLRAIKSRQALDLELRMLRLSEERFGAGTVSGGDVERFSTQAQQTDSDLIALQGQIDESLDQLAFLCGQTPGSLDARLVAPAPMPQVQSTPSLSSPAALLRQRPDIRAAERRLAASNALIGEKRAGAFPKVTLLGSLSFAGDNAADLWGNANFGWLGVPYLQWNLLDFGRNRHMVEQAQAQRDEVLAQYTSSVLSALRDANVALSRFGHERRRVEVLRQAEASAVRSAELSEQRYLGGTRSALDWLDAERTRNKAEQQLISGEAQLLASYVTLHKSLGLGWQSE